MVSKPKTASASAPEPTKKTKSSATKKSGGGRKKLTPFNRFMQTEMARLKETEPDIPHRERFKLVVDNWKKKKEEDAAAS